jgi:hypothetical protein
VARVHLVQHHVEMPSMPWPWFCTVHLSGVRGVCTWICAARSGGRDDTLSVGAASRRAPEMGEKGMRLDDGGSPHSYLVCLDCQIKPEG